MNKRVLLLLAYTMNEERWFLRHKGAIQGRGGAGSGLIFFSHHVQCVQNKVVM